MRLWLSISCGLALSAALLPLSGAFAQEGAVPSGKLRTEAVPLVLQKTVDDFIRPGYRNLVSATQDLTVTTKALCKAPSEEKLGAVQSSFNGVVKAWSAIEVVRVGPVIEGNRFERFLFYPDRKGTGLRQVQTLLAKPDETATSAKTLNGKSVAMQGLGALEFVLYGTGREDVTAAPESFRCRYGAAIADNLASVASGLSAEWEKPDGIQQAWKKPGPDNPVFRDDKEAITGVLGILVHGTEAVKDQRLQAFYKGTVNGVPDKGRPKSAIYWRSGNTMASVITNIEALKTLWETAGMQTLLDPGFGSLAGSVDFVFKSVLRVSRQIDLPVDRALAGKDEHARLDFVLLNINDLLNRLNKDYGGAIGLGAGFSFADGD
ncbi:imelysin family protein [Pararhizobium sp.]|uniref:imelysin family protein n=1 Tax=Pararhizobium sp. TaxID=1977563 RepID=UPI0027285761|nr:imelysin family protein [Pararhizobium sp.]MDO9417659.1 imelysin family protein [Pararhizobium sp.]